MEQEYISIEKVLSDLGIEASQNDVITVQDADVIAMSCCNKTDAVCWTQM